MSSDPSSNGFGQYQSSAIASATSIQHQCNDWTHLLASSNDSQAFQAKTVVQREGYNNQIYPQTVLTSGVPSAWVQSPWVQQHPQQTRFQQPISQFLDRPPQMLNDWPNTNAPVVPLTQKINSVALPMTTNTSPPNEGSNHCGEKKKEESDEVWGYQTFLGLSLPSLWDNEDIKVEIMAFDENLFESGLDEGQGRSPPSKNLTPPRSVASADGSIGSGDVRNSLPSSGSESSNSNKADSSVNSPVSYQSSHSPVQIELKYDECSNASESSNSTELDTVAPSSLEKTRPPVGRRKRNAVSTCSSFDNTSDDGSYVPGQEDFDPKSRQFSPEELRPQPMSKKSKKQYVPDDLKDDKYWARRRKNNMAAKRSRDARRVKENQIAMRANYLEKEIAGIRAELDEMTKLYADALKRLEQYENTDEK